MTSTQIGSSTAQKFTERREEHFLGDDDLGARVLEIVGEHLHPDRYVTREPWHTSTYCDTGDFRCYRKAEAGPTLCLRFREYSDAPLGHVLGSPRLWMELKETPPFKRKASVEVPGSAVPALLRGESDLPAGLARLAEGGRRLVESRVRPMMITQYRRVAFAAAANIIRITVDYDLRYFIPLAGSALLDKTTQDAIPLRIGPALGGESGPVIECKWSQDLPPWALSLQDLLHEKAVAGYPPKFVLGMRLRTASMTPDGGFAEDARTVHG